jgi:hypothetical protein
MCEPRQICRRGGSFDTRRSAPQAQTILIAQPITRRPVLSLVFRATAELKLLDLFGDHAAKVVNERIHAEVRTEKPVLE